MLQSCDTCVLCDCDTCKRHPGGMDYFRLAFQSKACSPVSLWKKMILNAAKAPAQALLRRHGHLRVPRFEFTSPAFPWSQLFAAVSLLIYATRHQLKVRTYVSDDDMVTVFREINKARKANMRRRRRKGQRMWFTVNTVKPHLHPAALNQKNTTTKMKQMALEH